jgi:imidazolonepropionase-like amidohydrolase
MRADGVAQVHLLVRELLRMGASQIKIATGGGVSSLYDPLDVTQYTQEEVEAAVADAENWGTYVSTHTFTDGATQMALRAGVKSVEHGFLLTEPKLLAVQRLYMHRTTKARIICAMPRASLRSILLICACSTARMCRVSTQITGRPA